MNIVSIENVSKSFGFKPLLENLTFGLDSADKIGLIGRNGAGKSTILRLIAGEEQPDSGRIAIARERSIVLLSQNPTFGDAETVLDAVFPPTSDAFRILHDYELACLELAEYGGDTQLARVAELTERISDTGGWDVEANAKIVLTRLGVGDTRAAISTLSGGQRKRVALARALVASPDLLILDEPTNHLDAETIEWLEGYLDDYTGALLVVTHDRYFLDRVTKRIFEVEHGTVRAFDGNYAYFLEKKAELVHAAETTERRRETDLRRELAWLRRGARARTTKEKARVQRVAELQSVERAPLDRDVEISVAARRLGSKIVELDDVSKAYGERILFDGFGYTMKRGDRLGVVGPNGSGKTTLLDVIAGRTAPDRGTVAVGETVVIGYFDQEPRSFDPDQRAIDYVKQVAGTVNAADGTVITASGMLERFLFPPDMQYAPIGKFSGGERRRLFLVRVLMSAPNVLLLDEPTNDLDIATLARLEAYLDSFSGCIIVVSHDRYFLDRIVDHVFTIERGGQIRLYPGDYSAFREARARERSDGQVTVPKEKPKADRSDPAEHAGRADQTSKKLSFNERRELDELEARISSSEFRKLEIQSELAASGTDYVALQRLTSELEALEAVLKRDVDRWGELAERA